MTSMHADVTVPGDMFTVKSMFSRTGNETLAPVCEDPFMPVRGCFRAPKGSIATVIAGPRTTTNLPDAWLVLCCGRVGWISESWLVDDMTGRAP